LGFARNLELEPGSTTFDLGRECPATLNVITGASGASGENLADNTSASAAFTLDTEYQGVYV